VALEKGRAAFWGKEERSHNLEKMELNFGKEKATMGSLLKLILSFG